MEQKYYVRRYYAWNKLRHNEIVCTNLSKEQADDKYNELTRAGVKCAIFTDNEVFTKFFAAKLEAGKRLTKDDLSWEIGRKQPTNILSLSPESFKREEIVRGFNKIFNMDIK